MLDTTGCIQFLCNDVWLPLLRERCKEICIDAYAFMGSKGFICVQKPRCGGATTGASG